MDDFTSPFRQPRSTTPVALSFLLALALEFFPWPADILRFKPVLPALALAYWALRRPRLVNYAAAVVVGVMMDLSNQAPMGFNVAGCSVIVFMCNIFNRRFVLLGGFGQSTHVFVILAAGQLTVFFLGLLEDSSSLAALRWRLFAPSLSAAALWLFLPFVFRRLSPFGYRHD